MKFLITLALTVSTLMASANARDNIFSGRVTLSDGSNILKISVGDQADTRAESLARRVRDLEQAVGDLQARIYDLEKEPSIKTKTVFVCSLTSDFDNVSIGKGDTQVEAEAEARRACAEVDNKMFCKKSTSCTSKEVNL
jgi:autotransporter translocation and assembly factor TamB